MSERSVDHATFVIERTYPVPPERVFKAFSSAEAKVRWFGGPEGWNKEQLQLDFRVGGHERRVGAGPDGKEYLFHSIYHDIVPNERIITSYEMQMDGQRISVSVATFEFKPTGKGTRLVVTEQGAFLDGLDTSSLREHGTGELLDALGKQLEG